jgi:hypothetical protein
MKDRRDFDISLAQGQIKERFVEVLLLVDGITVEVKCDFHALDTGRVFVEYASRGKKSGIAVTKAEYWAFVVGDAVLMVPTERVKMLVRLYWRRYRVDGGDNDTSRGVLVPLNHLVRGEENICHVD